MKKVEYAELKKAGLSEKALEVYSNSDYDVYDNGNGTYSVCIYNSICGDNFSLADLEAWFAFRHF